MTVVPQAERKTSLDGCHVFQYTGKWMVLVILGHVSILKKKERTKEKLPKGTFFPKQGSKPEENKS